MTRATIISTEKAMNVVAKARDAIQSKLQEKTAELETAKEQVLELDVLKARVVALGKVNLDLPSHVLKVLG